MFVALPMMAQESASVSGTVFDATGATISGATVTINGWAQGIARR